MQQDPSECCAPNQLAVPIEFPLNSDGITTASTDGPQRLRLAWLVLRESINSPLEVNSQRIASDFRLPSEGRNSRQQLTSE